MRQIRQIARRTVRLAPLMVVLAAIGLVAAACSSSEPTPTPVVIEKEVVRQIEVVVTATPEPTGPTQTPVVVEKEVVRQVEVVVTPTPAPSGPTPTPVVVVVTPTPAPPSPTATPAPTSTPAPATRTVTDDFRRTIEIPFHPQRVAVTNAWMVELLMACGVTPVARPQIPLEFVYPPAAHDVPVLGVSHSAGPNLEQLAAARPDLVLTSPTYGRFAEPIQQALSVPVLVYDLDSVDGILDKLDLFGTLAGCAEGAQQAATDLRVKIAEQQEGLPDEGPTVFGIFGTSESFLGFTSASYLGDMVNLLGGRMITEGDPPYMYRGMPNPAYTPFSLEKVVERDPDVILVVRHGNPEEAREENFSALFSNPAWAGLTAVQEGRVYELSEWLYLRYPGPRAAWAMQELRPLLYPEAEDEGSE